MEINFKNINELIEFQAINKYLFMAYSPEKQKKLWNIIAKYDKTNFEVIKKEFLEIYYEIIKEEITKWKYINAISHMFWYFKKEITKEEKNEFEKLTKIYLDNNIETEILLKFIKKLSIKYKKDYIEKQSIL